MGMLNNLTGWHALVILAVIVLLFGAAKLPTLAKSIGQSMKILKTELKTEQPPAHTDGPDASETPITADAKVPLSSARSTSA